MLKANLHFHTGDDTEDPIQYTFHEGIDRAASLGFEIMGLTCHNQFIDSPDYAAYAEKRGILLIPGIEKTIEKRHVVILNANKQAERINTFIELQNYKKIYPDIFIIAPHPYFYGNFSLKEKLEQHLHLFDAIEHSWFYSKIFNRNTLGEFIAKKHNLPFIATSDTHILEILGRSYALIDSKTKTVPAIFQALRENKYRNVTAPLKTFDKMIARILTREFTTRLDKLFAKNPKQSTVLSKRGLASLIPEEFPSLDQ